MKIENNAITYWAKKRQMSIQIPKNCFGSSPVFIEVPDYWFMKLKNKHLCFGEESGYLYLSPKGWIENKDRIKEVFESSKSNQDWSVFEETVKVFFTMVHKRTIIYLKLRRSYLEKFENNLRNFEMSRDLIMNDME